MVIMTITFPYWCCLQDFFRDHWKPVFLTVWALCCCNVCNLFLLHRRLMTLRVLNVASETVATSTAGIRSAAIPCLPLDTAEMILSTAWIPLAPVPGRHLRQMLSSGEAAMVGWILKKLHVLELNINKSHLSPARGFALGRQTPYPPCWKLVTLN